MYFYRNIISGQIFAWEHQHGHSPLQNRPSDFRWHRTGSRNPHPPKADMRWTAWNVGSGATSRLMKRSKMALLQRFSDKSENG